MAIAETGAGPEAIPKEFSAGVSRAKGRLLWNCVSLGVDEVLKDMPHMISIAWNKMVVWLVTGFQNIIGCEKGKKKKKKRFYPLPSLLLPISSQGIILSVINSSIFPPFVWPAPYINPLSLLLVIKPCPSDSKTIASTSPSSKARAMPRVRVKTLCAPLDDTPQTPFVMAVAPRDSYLGEARG